MKKTQSVAWEGHRALEGEWRGQVSVEPVPGARHPEDTVPRASPPRPHIRAVVPCLQSAMTGVGGFGSTLCSCSFIIFTLAVPKASSSSALRCPLLTKAFQDGREGPPALGTPSLTGSMRHCPELRTRLRLPLLPPNQEAVRAGPGSDLTCSLPEWAYGRSSVSSSTAGSPLSTSTPPTPAGHLFSGRDSGSQPWTPSAWP